MGDVAGCCTQRFSSHSKPTRQNSSPPITTDKSERCKKLVFAPFSAKRAFFVSKWTKFGPKLLKNFASRQAARQRLIYYPLTAEIADKG
jgi:hypothetical protein